MTQSEPSDWAFVHEIKISPDAYRDVLRGIKTFEVRLNDRAYQRGDKVLMRLWENGSYNTQKPPITATISYVTAFQQKDNWCVFGLHDVKEY